MTQNILEKGFSCKFRNLRIRNPDSELLLTVQARIKVVISIFNIKLRRQFLTLRRRDENVHLGMSPDEFSFLSEIGNTKMFTNVESKIGGAKHNRPNQQGVHIMINWLMINWLIIDQLFYLAQ